MCPLFCVPSVKTHSPFGIAYPNFRVEREGIKLAKETVISELNLTMKCRVEKCEETNFNSNN